jgi:nucleotide-binding universal stress UspA family protein
MSAIREDKLMYKTILVHVDQSPLMADRLQAAAALALDHGAHLVGAATTGMSWSSYALLTGSMAVTPIDEFDALRAGARSGLSRFSEAARRLGLAAPEERLVEDEERQALLLQSRYADLVVVSRESGDGLVQRGLPEYVALHGARPVLMVPPGWAGQAIGGDAVVGWDGSLAAIRAIDGALPLLCRARNVRLALINPEREAGLHGEEPGADMALYLARHGVPVEVLVERSELPAGEVLLGMARASNAGLLVSGAFGHRRFREIVLGGVTRILLARAPLPVLLAH